MTRASVIYVAYVINLRELIVADSVGKYFAFIYQINFIELMRQRYIHSVRIKYWSFT